MELYTKDGRKIDVEITICDIIEVITYNEDFVDKMIEENPADYRYGLSFNEFVFLCLNLENPDVLEENADAFYNFYYKYNKKIEYIELISILAEKSRGHITPEFEIDTGLLKLLNENMNPNYTTEEQIIYYYFKLCFLLSIDNLYNFACLAFGELGAMNFKKSPNRLSEINNIDNMVACFEFSAIIDKLITSSGEYAAKWVYTGDRTHINTEAVINKKLYKFDALEDPLGRNKSYRDLLNVKLNYGYNGIIAGYEDLINGVNSHLPYIDKIYNDVQKEFSWFLTQKKYSKEIIHESLSYIDYLDVNQNIKQVLKEYFINFNSVPLKGIEYFLEILGAYKNTIEEHTNRVVQLTGVASTTESYDFKIVVSVITNKNEYIYFLLGDDNIDILSEDKLTELIELNDIIITQGQEFIRSEKGYPNCVIKYRTIPGIDEEFQIRMNKQAEKTVLWPMLQETYQESLNAVKGAKKLIKSTDN